MALAKINIGIAVRLGPAMPRCLPGLFLDRVEHGDEYERWQLLAEVGAMSASD